MILVQNIFEVDVMSNTILVQSIFN